MRVCDPGRFVLPQLESLCFTRGSVFYLQNTCVWGGVFSTILCIQITSRAESGPSSAPFHFGAVAILCAPVLFPPIVIAFCVEVSSLLCLNFYHRILSILAECQSSQKSETWFLHMKEVDWKSKVKKSDFDKRTKWVETIVADFLCCDNTKKISGAKSLQKNARTNIEKQWFITQG